MSIFDRHGMDTRTKYPTRTVLVIATTREPIPGFRFQGRRVDEGGRVRLPVTDAKHFERVGKCKIVPDSEETVLM